MKIEIITTKCPYYLDESGTCSKNENYTCYKKFKYCDIYRDWIEEEGEKHEDND